MQPVNLQERTVKRSYLSILCGVPDPSMARIEAPVGRDPRDRKRQTVIEGLSIASRNRSRHAASKYKVREWLAGGACGLVEWRLETGRTHQVCLRIVYHHSFPFAFKPQSKLSN
jgi:23S rRNA pseudouridine1911/1915/1917 synthase